MFILSLPIIIMIAAAVIPGLVLLKYIYNKDHIEKESRKLLIKLLILGVISTICALFTETVGSTILGGIFDTNNLIYIFIENFIVVALSEEGFKYLVLKRATWKNPEFDCSFDAVVYAVFVSLGFAIWENIQYVISYGFTTALIRAITAVPGHTCFGILMGAFYGLAKKRESTGDLAASKKHRRWAVIVPVIAHGSYDFFATISAGIGSVAFIVIILILYFICFNLVKGLSSGDDYINNDPDFKYE